MKEKKCKDCGKTKPTADFYGLQGECKECTKTRVAKREVDLRKNPEFIEKERQRGRDKYHRLYSEALKPYIHKIEDGTTFFERYPEKYQAASASSYLPKPFDKAERHHWSYNKEHFRSLIWLTRKQHAQAHRYIVYDQERKMYRRYDNNELLDTKEKHETFIFNCIETKKD